MERLWAPWRMEYILGNKEGGCFICDIVASDDDRRNLVIRREERCILLMNRFPYNNGHMMVAPARHVDTLEAMERDELCEMMLMTSQACSMLRSVVHADGFNTGLNLGSAAGAGLRDHVHMHIVPRWEGDTNFMPVIADTKVIPQSLDDLWNELRAFPARQG